VNREEAMQSGMRQHQAGQLAAAEKIYRQILHEEPNHADALQLLGIIAGQRGDADAAIDLIRKSIQLKPDHPGAYRNLAPLLAQKNQFDDAVAAYKKFLELRPDSPEIHRDLGVALRACGRLDEAFASVSRAIELKPDFAVAHNELGNVATVRNRMDEAIAAYSRAIALKPDFAEAHNNLGNALSTKGLIEEALAAYRRAAACNGNLAAAHNGIGNMLRRIGRNDEAISAYRTAIRLKPDFALAHFNLGQAYRVAGRPGEALAAFRDALKIDRGNAEVYANMAAVLAELNRFDEAMNCHAQLAALKPDAAITHEVLGKITLERQDAAAAAEHFRRALTIDSNLDTAWHGLGTALQSLGEFDEAAKCFRHMLELCPRAGVGVIYRHLFDTGSDAIGAADIEQVKAFLREPNIPAVSRLAAGFALGKALDEAGQFDEAFTHYAQANSLVKQLRTSVGEIYDPAAVHRLNEQMMDVFTRSYFEKRRGWGEHSELPVFVVGMPRSGTTLVQQIAASHPQVHGAGELSDIADITKSLGGTDVTSAANGWARDLIDAAAQRYIRRLRALDESASRVIDKMPSNVHRLGLIALLFPSARVIFCRRDARDTCLSCFFQWFGMGNTFSFDLAHCGHEYLATERLMTHWQTALPLKILDVQYEELVTDLEGQSRRLIDFLDLPWDPACLEFHRTRTTILTASSWQVRQPIYQRSVGRWRHYEKHLGPLLEVLNGSL
jgi:tetratricopeptide (TPR) repeat protein